MSGALADALAEIRESEHRRAARALLLQPLITAAGRRREDFLLVRKHAAELTSWFDQHAGWRLTVDSDVARLRKRAGVAGDTTRGAQDARGTAFSRRRYVLFALALAVLERAESQTTLGRLAEAVVAGASEPRIRDAGVSFTLAGRDERSDIVIVVRMLLDLGVLRRVAGTEEAFVADSGDVLYDIDRRVLSTVPMPSRGPSTVPDSSMADRLAAIADDPPLGSDELRNRYYRRDIVRRLLDDPVLYYDELEEQERAYLVNQRRSITDRITELTGLVAELRAEGIAMVDSEDRLTDVRMPESGTDGHVTLLVAEFLALGLRSVAPAAVIEEVERLIPLHRSRWRKDVTEPGAAEQLTALALARLEALRLIRMTGSAIEPLPALARYAVGDTVLVGDRPAVAAAEDPAPGRTLWDE